MAALRRLLRQQREDGGWAQTPDLASDAYATGQALYTLHELGVSVNDPAYRRGVQYLLQTQAADGSWLVKSRAAKFQPYFETTFPYGHDQWISLGRYQLGGHGAELRQRSAAGGPPVN